MNATERASYYNTTKVRGRLLKKFQDQATDQDALIMNFFMERPSIGFTPCQVWKRINGGHPCPLTSVRRSITNLTSVGVLEKLDFKVKGIYGRPAHVWQLNPEFLIYAPVQNELPLL